MCVCERERERERKRERKREEDEKEMETMTAKMERQYKDRVKNTKMQPNNGKMIVAVNKQTKKMCFV